MQEGVSSTASDVLFLEKLVVDPLVRPVLWGVFLFGLRAGMFFTKKFSKDLSSVVCSAACSPLAVVSLARDGDQIVCACVGGDQKRVNSDAAE